ncbi:HlyD family efflux transporter periplasmic adaptor subunit [Granulosicoccaceae sp. 1_MG-2023]|nr:HlyD family efflux transporter periplasmic adaptor subunit [Granulosicoccaceae sp. 1_MG-2023]
MSRKHWMVITVAVLVGLLSTCVWRSIGETPLETGFVSGNGRMEATEIHLATPLGGQLESVLVREGDWVERGQLLARMDTRRLQAQKRQAEAQVEQARQEQHYTEALINQRESELKLAKASLARLQKLYERNGVSLDTLEQAQAAESSARAMLNAAKAQQIAALAAIRAAQASVDSIDVSLAESELTAPVSGRVLYRLAEPGEVLGTGGRILTLLDLTDVWMTIYLPSAESGQVAIGAAARIRLDAFPNLVVPASVSFVAPRSQFTPRDVETRSERDTLMFRVKVKIDPRLLRKYIERVKTGLPGEAWVQLDSNRAWPEDLRANVGLE